MCTSALFDELTHIRHLERSQKHFSAYDFIYRFAAEDMRLRLADITRLFSSVLISGFHAPTFFIDQFPDATYIQRVSPELLSQYQGQFDCILSMGDMHCANDLPGLLIQMRRALKPDGVMVAAFSGGETLYELRQSLMAAEVEIKGGASPRVHPFADKQQVAGLMQRTGFSLPVVDSEILTVAYPDINKLARDIRGMGEANCLNSRSKEPLSRSLWQKVKEIYAAQFLETDGRITATYEIVFVIGWAPHDSQQQPARRGSGQVSLTEIL